jgi:hypothetical protein
MAVDLGGMRVSDDPSRPDKFTFAPGTTIPAGSYLTLLPGTAGSGILLGFPLSPIGGRLFLLNSAAAGGAVVDSITYGLPIPNSSVGRLGPDARWALSQPTPGGPNIAKATGDPSALVINEWFTSQDANPADDFVELYNPGPLPVALGGLFITDDPGARPLRHAIAPLSYIAPGGFVSLIADGDETQGANHLSFRLTAEDGRIALFSGGPPLVGDFNNDGRVDTADYIVWRNSSGQIVPGGSGADANDDGLIDQTDYNLWRANYDRTAANPGIRTNAAVPYWDVPALSVIDFVTYMPQTTDHSQGRSPNGGTTLRYFVSPTPGSANPTMATAAAADLFFDDFGAKPFKPARHGTILRPTARPIAVPHADDSARQIATLKVNAGNSSTERDATVASEQSSRATDETTSDFALAEYLTSMLAVKTFPRITFQ